MREVAARPEVAGLTCEAVSKSFGATRAVDDVTLTARAGESIGLLGPNGAGKTTLLALLSGLRRPDRGRVRVADLDPRRPGTRRLLGVVPQVNATPDTLRVGEVLRFAAAHHDDPTELTQLTRFLHLEHLRDRVCGSLSGGQRRRVSLALALVGRPRLLLLDEPTAGLDARSQDIVDAVIRRAQDDAVTVVVSSHNLRDIERGCTRVVVLKDGRVVADDPLADFRARVEVRQIRLRTHLGDDPIRALPGVVQVTPAGVDGVRRIDSRDADATLHALLRRDESARDITVGAAHLDDVLRALLHADDSA